MAYPPAVVGAGAAPAIPFTIPEDSIFRKAVTCIPFLGVAFQIANDLSIQNKCFTYTHSGTPIDNNRLIYMLNVKNHFNVAFLVQTILTIACMAAVVALGIFGSYMAIPAILLGGLFGGIAGLCILDIYQQRKIVTYLQVNGYQSGMKLW
jgi:hypothetical protein